MGPKKDIAEMLSGEVSSLEGVEDIEPRAARLFFAQALVLEAGGEHALAEAYLERAIDTEAIPA